MGARKSHRKGSLAFRPRKRAVSQMPTVGAWPKITEKRLLGFAGYKAGMTHVLFIDDSPSPTKGTEVSAPVTVLEVPPMSVFAIRFYKAGHVLSDFFSSDAKLLAPLGIKKKEASPAIPAPVNIDNVFVLAYASPGKTGFGKKGVEAMEIAVGGKDCAEKLEYANSILGKDIKLADVFREGEIIDTLSITKGKGWEGQAKRFGTSLQRRKATGKRRHIGTLGPWHPGYVMYTVPMAGQHGYHKRTEISKRIMKIGSGNGINPKGGFLHYGIINGDYVLIKGSIAGPVKRLIRMRCGMRAPSGGAKPIALKHISTDSKQ
jgi:large subunit ribosomal protein L3